MQRTGVAYMLVLGDTKLCDVRTATGTSTSHALQCDFRFVHNPPVLKVSF